MPSWWMKSSSKGAKKKLNKGSFIDTLHRRSKIPSEGKINSRTATGRRRSCTETVPEKESQCQGESKSALPSKEVPRCQTEKPSAQPLPLPARRAGTSKITASAKPRSKKGSKSLFLSIPKPVCIRCRRDPCDLDDDLATASVSSGCSIVSEDPADSHQQSPPVIDHDRGSRTAAGIPPREQPYIAAQLKPEVERPAKLLSNHHISHLSPKRRPLHGVVTNLQIPPHGAFFSAPDSSMSSPSRSPMRGFGNEQITSTAFWAGKAFPDVSLLGSGNCSSPGSGCNSVYNSIGGDMPGGPLFWQQSRGSPEYSPILSPRMASPGPNSRVHSGAVTPLHPRAGGSATDLQKIWPDDGNQQSHRLPLPPVTNSNSLVFSHSNSVATSPSVSRSPGRAENLASPDSCWKKGKLLGRGTFGHVYVAFNSGSGEMCAMKEVTLFSDDAKSRESAKQLGQEIALLSRLRHPNIVQYYGCETVGDRLYIFLEYVSGGSIYKLLQDYGKFGELVIRIYTQQILSGLAYLHAKNTVHRDIKGANILVDPNGRVKLADFGMAKHITGQSCPLSLKGSPYWMAPEVIQNSSGSNLAVDIWSLGCTVLEMATSKPPWSQFEGVAAMFKIGNSKELPVIPDNLSDEGKDFLRQCLQRNPRDRPTAAQLLEHPFVKDTSHLEKTLTGSEALVASSGGTNGGASMGVGLARNVSSLESCGLAIHSIGVPKSGPAASGVHTRRYISCPVSPIRSPRLHPRLPPNPNRRSGYTREELSGSMLRGERQNGKKALNGVEPT